jgi:hypothetical protein
MKMNYYMQDETLPPTDADEVEVDEVEDEEDVVVEDDDDVDVTENNEDGA